LLSCPRKISGSRNYFSLAVLLGGDLTAAFTLVAVSIGAMLGLAFVTFSKLTLGVLESLAL
jgi:hypothetical protein